MLRRLLRVYAIAPLELWRTAWVLRAYRLAQERLRSSESAIALPGAQIDLACRLSGFPRPVVLEKVHRWMEVEPLAYLGRYARNGLHDFLRRASERNIVLGVSSDYEAEEKLSAIGIAQYFKVVVSAQDKEVQRFKPHPRVLEVALSRMGVDRSRALYVGDRPDIDSEAARRMGIPCFIIGTHRTRPSSHFSTVRDFAELRDALNV
jgi:FMN phosphatase YigB (HAD superfamily)